MKRKISKRFELNRKEAELLRIKARQTGLSEGEYLRELISNSQPVEAPPRQFYEAMGQMGRIVSEVSNLVEKASVSVEQPMENLDELWSICQQLQALLVEIKRIVSSARYYAASAYEWWIHEVEQARKEGRVPPDMDEYEPRDRSGDIQSPEDPNLGWNALGISPPFLYGYQEAAKNESIDGSFDDEEGGVGDYACEEGDRAESVGDVGSEEHERDETDPG